MQWNFLHLFNGSVEAWWQEILFQLEKKSTPSLITVATPNPEQVVLALHQPEFAKLLSQFRYQLPDGVGLVLASRWRGRQLGLEPCHARIPGVEVVRQLLKEAKRHCWRVLVIGGRQYAGTQVDSVPIVLADSAEKLTDKSFAIYWTMGFQNARQPTQAEHQALAKTLTAIRPDLVFVGLGAPAQEKWVISHTDLLKASGVKLAMVTGGAFDMLTGRLRRAPQLIQRLHLEWLFRLMQEPSRWRRQLALLEFGWRALTTG